MISNSADDFADTDRIQKHILLRASRARVWRALTNAQDFGSWFGVNLEGDIKPGARLRGQITHKDYQHLTMEIEIDRMEPERLFSYRWHPYAIDKNIDYSSEPPTLVTFELADAEGGIQLTVTESGFDRIPAARRVEAFRMNSQGWAAQMKNIEEHVRRTT